MNIIDYFFLFPQKKYNILLYQTIFDNFIKNIKISIE